MKKKKEKSLQTAEEAGRKARRQITLIVITGTILLIADIAASALRPSVTVVENEKGVYIIRPSEAEEAACLSLRAEVKGTKGTVEEKADIMVEPYSQESDVEETEMSESKTEKSEKEGRQIGYELRGIVSRLNDDKTVRQIMLPQRLDTGEKISWSVEDSEKSNVFIISAMTVLMIFTVYRNRFAAIKKQQQENRQSVIRALPEFVNRLVLLLNAGLVLTNAFEKSVEEGFDIGRGEDDYFYRKLREVYMLSKTANGSMHTELRRVARESGIRELMRVSNIISDNINKGVELTHKLQAESELLWLKRKKACEERGRLAETKLTLPLMIFLMVLIMITVAPALLEL